MPSLCTMIEVIMQKGIQAIAKRLGIRKILIEIDFRKQQTEILEVFPADRFATLLIDFVGKLHDMLVVEVKSFCGQCASSIKFAQQLMIEFRLSILVHPLKHRVFEVTR